MFEFDKLAAIRKCLRKPAPQRYSLSQTNWKNIDYFTAILAKDDEALLVTAICSEGIIGLFRDGDSFCREGALKIRHLDEFELRVYRAYRNIQEVYNTPSELFWRERTFFVQRQYIQLRTLSFLQRYTTRFRRERVSLLRKLVELHLANEDTFAEPEGKSPMRLFEDLYGFQAFGHPRFDLEFKTFKLLLDSLARDGSITGVGPGFLVSGAALTHISNYELEEKRHRDNWRLAAILSALTLILAVDSAYSLYTAIFGSEIEESRPS